MASQCDACTAFQGEIYYYYYYYYYYYHHHHR
jgi:hypothetical protein